MSAPRGRTYQIQIDVIAEEYVTILESGDLLLEDAVTGDPLLVPVGALSAYAASNPPFSAHVAECIRKDLLADTHDSCAWDWTEQPASHWWYRSGRCPTCGQW